jgi:hypothetical protein
VISSFLSEHLIVGALLISALWFFCGYADIKKGKRVVGFSWQIVGVLILVAFCINAALASSWYTLTAGAIAILIEMQLIRIQRRDNQERDSGTQSTKKGTA